ncbi:MAG: T9SS type A sorting domain-containing protein, partial [Candidatus Kapaibacterium sp.]
ASPDAGTVVVTDLLGRMVRSEPVSTQFVSLLGLERGLYMVSVIAGTQRYVHTLLIH